VISNNRNDNNLKLVIIPCSEEDSIIIIEFVSCSHKDIHPSVFGYEEVNYGI